MKNYIAKGSLLTLLFTTGIMMSQEHRQAKKKEVEVTKYTVMERFEPELMLSAQERVQLKKDRIAEIERRREILDTLDISERKRERLMRDLMKDPFSTRLSRTLAEIEFSDENE